VAAWMAQSTALPDLSYSMSVASSVAAKPAMRKITAGHRLTARHVIHAVGPVWRGGGHGEAKLLASCYRRSLELAVEHTLKVIAFPSISTGAYGYPIEEAGHIAVRTVTNVLASLALPERVIFCTTTRTRRA